MDYIVHNENEEATLVESRENESLSKEGETRFEKYKAAVKEAAKNNSRG